jgi:polyhydroxyalkanoate synthesis regulator phasin
MEKQVRQLMKRNKIDPKEAQAMLRHLGARLQRERKRALAQLESRIKTLQARVKKERKAFGKAVDEGVQRGLAAFNIPSRQEVADLTRKVEELSRKIDSLRRPSARRRTAASAPMAVPA